MITQYYETGEKKDFEVYSCHVSADGARLVTAAGGMDVDVDLSHTKYLALKGNRWIRPHLVDRSNSERP